MKSKFCIIIFLATLLPRLSAQMLYDTSYIYKAYDRSIWGIYQNYYSNNHVFDPFMPTSDTTHNNTNWTAESFKEIGFSYTKNTFYLAVNVFGVLNFQSERKPKPQYVNVITSYCNNRYLFELNVNWFKGYYDLNSEENVPNFTNTSDYYSLPGMWSLNVNIKGMYFTRYKKFSFNAAYKNSERQKKSNYSPLFFANVYYNRLQSDSSFFSSDIRLAYGDQGQINRWYSTALNAGAGISATAVIAKTFFINGTLMVGPNFQVIEKGFAGNKQLTPYFNVGLFANARFSIGLNFKQFFIYSAINYDFRYCVLSNINYAHSFFTNSVTIGYRFKTKIKPR